jgi:hypothetical protein
MSNTSFLLHQSYFHAHNQQHTIHLKLQSKWRPTTTHPELHRCKKLSNHPRQSKNEVRTMSETAINPNPLDPRHTLTLPHLSPNNIRTLAHNSNQMHLLRLISVSTAIPQKLPIHLLEFLQITLDLVEINQNLLDFFFLGAVGEDGAWGGVGGVGW